MTLKGPSHARQSESKLADITDTRPFTDGSLLHGAENWDPAAVGLMARVLVQTTIPHSVHRDIYFQRRNGDLTLTMVGHPDHGLPYGKMPRLLLAWLARAAKSTGARELRLPASQAALFRDLGVRVSGGRTGSLHAVREQALRLVKCTVHIDRRVENRETWRPYQLASGASLWWDRSNAPDASNGCWIELAPGFYDEIISYAVPLDFRVLVALRSPMAIDIYAWATDRVYRLTKSLLLPWPALRGQFGSDYGRLVDFRAGFLRALKNVHGHWPGLRAQPESAGLRLQPCRPHVAPVTFVPGLTRSAR